MSQYNAEAQKLWFQTSYSDDGMPHKARVPTSKPRASLSTMTKDRSQKLSWLECRINLLHTLGWITSSLPSGSVDTDSSVSLYICVILDDKNTVRPSVGRYCTVHLVVLESTDKYNITLGDRCVSTLQGQIGLVTYIASSVGLAECPDLDRGVCNSQ